MPDLPHSGDPDTCSAVARPVDIGMSVAWKRSQGHPAIDGFRRCRVRRDQPDGVTTRGCTEEMSLAKCSKVLPVSLEVSEVSTDSPEPKMTSRYFCNRSRHPPQPRPAPGHLAVMSATLRAPEAIVDRTAQSVTALQ